MKAALSNVSEIVATFHVFVSWFIVTVGNPPLLSHRVTFTLTRSPTKCGCDSLASTRNRRSDVLVLSSRFEKALGFVDYCADADQITLANRFSLKSRGRFDTHVIPMTEEMRLRNSLRPQNSNALLRTYLSRGVAETTSKNSAAVWPTKMVCGPPHCSSPAKPATLIPYCLSGRSLKSRIETQRLVSNRDGPAMQACSSVPIRDVVFGAEGTA